MVKHLLGLVKKVENLLFIQNGLAYIAQTAFFSLASVYFVDILHYSLSTTAVMLFYSSMVVRTSRIIFLPILDAVNFNISFPFSLLLCSLGFMGLAIVSNPIGVALMILPIGIGYGVNNILIKFALSEVNNDQPMIRRFAKYSISVNLGAALGPLIGNLFISNHYKVGITLFSSAIFMIAFVVSSFATKKASFHAVRQNWPSAILKLFSLSEFRHYFVLSCLGWFLYGQFCSSLPLFVSQNLAKKEYVGIIFFINAIVAIVCPMQAVKTIQKYTKDEQLILMISFSFYTLGLFMVGVFPDLIFIFVAVIMMSLGEVLMLPTLNSYLTRITSSEERIVSFTLASLTMGIGEATGSFAGTYAIKLGEYYQQLNLPFLVLATIAILFLIFGYALQKRRPRKDVGCV